MDFKKDIELLPYRFIDPHKLDKKIDPRKRTFGSKINEGVKGKRQISQEISIY